MSTTAKKGNTIDYPESGSYLVTCYGLIVYGTIRSEFKGEEKWITKIRLLFELPTEKVTFNEDKGEQPFSTWIDFTLSLNEKSNLHKFIRQWRNKPFTSQELNGFDTKILIGQVGNAAIEKATSKSGNEFLKINGIQPLPKGTQRPKQINETLFFDIDNPDKDVFYDRLPKFLRDIIRSSKEYTKKGLNWPELEDEITDETASANAFNDTGFSGSENYDPFDSTSESESTDDLQSF